MLFIAFIAIAVVIFAVPSNVTAQIELSGFYGYQFWGSQSGPGGESKIKPSSNFGGTLNVPLQSGVVAELLYMRQPTKLEARFFGLNEPRIESVDMSVEYFQVGGLYEYPTGNITPYGVVTLGAALFNPEPNEIKSDWRFAFGVGGGVKIFPTERIGLRFEGRLLFPVQWAGAGLGCGTGGCNIGVSTGTTVIQGALTAGIIVALGN
jgi:opacity protein-like surface antigen